MTLATPTRCLLLPALLVAVVASGAPLVGPAQAHCCHEDREVLVARQSSFRRGLNDPGQPMEGGLGRRENPPSIGPGLDSGPVGPRGGPAGLRGDGLGRYGAGSVGERGPGGFGGLTGDFIGPEPPRPR